MKNAGRHYTGHKPGSAAARILLAAVLVISMSPFASPAARAEGVPEVTTEGERAAVQVEPESSLPAPDAQNDSANAVDGAESERTGYASDAAEDAETTPAAATPEDAALQADARRAPADARRAPAALTAVYVDGTNGDDANDGSSFDGNAVKTLAKALEVQAANAAVTTIYVKGNLSLDATVSIPSGVTLSIASEGATISGGGHHQWHRP